jgi:hypothetical protein
VSREGLPVSDSNRFEALLLFLMAVISIAVDLLRAAA